MFYMIRPDKSFFDNGSTIYVFFQRHFGDDEKTIISIKKTWANIDTVNKLNGKDV